jgi:nucleotide-binding universal stress UspA family protein
VELAIVGGSGRGGDKSVLIGGSSDRVREERESVVIVVAGVTV